MITEEMILQALSNCIFDELCDRNYYDNVISNMDTTILPRSYNTGATKLVLTPPGEDFVIKIPFEGETWEKEDFSPFENAQEPNGWDYCRVEVLQYQKAVEAGLEEFFAETEYIGHINGHPIYIQTKVDIFEDIRDPYYDYEEETISSTKDTCKKLEVGCFHKYWLTDFLDYFNERDLLKLSQHLSNNDIGDLHGGNLGYIEGQPIIVDYSGYWE